MLKVVLCGNSSSFVSELKSQLNDIFLKAGYQAKIVVASVSPQDLFDYIPEAAGIILYILNITYEGGKISGIEIAKSIREKDRISYIVFFADSYESVSLVVNGTIRPSGYFVMPAKRQEMELVFGDIYRDYLNIQSKENNLFYVNLASTVYRIEYSKILYFEAFQKKVYIHTDNQRIGYYDSLSALEERLGDKFIRCHKSYIVNKEKIFKVSFSDMKIYMQNGAAVDISRSYKSILKEKL